MRSEEQGPGQACGSNREAPEDTEGSPNLLLELPAEPGGSEPARPMLRTSQNLVSPELGPAPGQNEGAECLATVPSAWGPPLIAQAQPTRTSMTGPRQRLAPVPAVMPALRSPPRPPFGKDPLILSSWPSNTIHGVWR